MKVYLSKNEAGFEAPDGSKVLEYNVDAIDIVAEKYTVRVRTRGVEIFERKELGLESVLVQDLDLTDSSPKKEKKEKKEEKGELA
jgi:hypothetical protein